MTPYKLYFSISFCLLLFGSCAQYEVPTIKIFKEGGIGWNEKEQCSVRYISTSDSIQVSGKIKCRGGSSSKYYKHSFSLELEEKQYLAGLPKDDDWVLNANYIDKTFMRHKISYDLFKEMNPLNIAPKSAYVNVKINDKYEGLYVLMQEINGAMVDLNKKDTGAVLFKDPPIFYKDKLSWVQDSLNYFQQKYPNINELDKTPFIEEFQQFIFYSSDEDFEKNVNQKIDLKNVIDWHLLLLFSNNSDGIIKNFFLYKLNSAAPLRFAIWDYDHSFGRDGDNEKNLLEREIDCKRAILLKRLLESKKLNYLSRLKKRWFELRNQDIFSVKNFKNHVERNDKIIRNHVSKNFEKWPIDDKNYYDSSNYQQELDLMQEFVRLRLQQLDERFGYS